MLIAEQVGEGVDGKRLLKVIEGDLGEVLFGVKDAVDVPEGFEAVFAKARRDLLGDGVVGFFRRDVNGKSVQAGGVEVLSPERMASWHEKRHAREQRLGVQCERGTAWRFEHRYLRGIGI